MQTTGVSPLPLHASVRATGDTNISGHYPHEGYVGSANQIPIYQTFACTHYLNTILGSLPGKDPELHKEFYHQEVITL